MTTDADPQQPDESTPRARVTTPEDGIGDRIREAREARGWTQKVLSNRCRMADANGEGIGRSVLANYETGKTKPGAREIRILCDTLAVTPNWLLYKEERPLKATLSSLVFLEGTNQFETALRLAFALVLLKPHEQQALGSLALSLAGRELDDLRLSGLMMASNFLSRSFLENLASTHPEEFSSGSIDEAIKRFVVKLADGYGSNWGNKLQLDGDEVSGGEWMYPPKP